MSQQKCIVRKGTHTLATQATQAHVFSEFVWDRILSTHVQCTRSVTGRKRGDASRRIVTACRVVTTRHESLPTVSIVTREVTSRKVITKWTSLSSVHVPPKKLADRDDPRRVANLAQTATNRHTRETTMHANDESNTNKQAKKMCEYSSF